MADEKSIKLQKDIVRALHDVLNDRVIDANMIVDDVVLGMSAFLTMVLKTLRTQGVVPGSPQGCTFEGTLWTIMDHIADFASPIKDVDTMSLWYIKHYEDWVSQLRENFDTLKSACDGRFIKDNQEIINTMKNIDDGFEMQLHGRLKLDGLEKLIPKREEKFIPVQLPAGMKYLS